MTVRWKPLLFLSGLFVIVGLMGLMTMAMVMGSKGTADILGRARTERKAKKYDEAKLDYQRALKLDGKNPAIHEEVADLYDEWARQAPAEKKAELRGLYLASLTSAIKNGAKRVEPRRKMLAEAIRLDDVTEQVRWAKDLATLDPNDRDAHYVLATQGLDGTSPNFPEIRRHLAVLESETPRRARCDWIAARTAALTNDKASLDDILKKSRSITLADDAHPVDRMAMLRLRALDVANIPDASELSGPVDAVSREALAASSEPEIPSTRIARISLLIEEVQKSLIRRGQDAPASQDRLHAYAETLDLAADKIFRKSLDVKGGADLNVYLGVCRPPPLPRPPRPMPGRGSAGVPVSRRHEAGDDRGGDGPACPRRRVLACQRQGRRPIRRSPPHTSRRSWKARSRGSRRSGTSSRGRLTWKKRGSSPTRKPPKSPRPSSPASEAPRSGT